MKIKTLIAAMALAAATLVSCTQLDNPAPYDNQGSNGGTAQKVFNLTPSFIGTISGVEEGKEYTPGSTLTLTLTPGETLFGGFASYHMEHIHIHVGDKVYMPEFPAGADEYAQEVTVDITVPSEPFYVVAAYAVQQQLSESGFTMRLEDNGDGVKLYGVSQDQKYKYFDCYLLTPEAYSIDKIEYKMGDSEWQEISTFGWECSYQRSYDVDNVYQVTIRPNYEDVTGDVVIRISGTQHKRCKITWKNTEFINFDVPEGYQPNILPESAIGGEQVMAQFYTKDDYYLAGAASSVGSVVPECYSRAYVVFTMPEEDVEITLDFKEKIPVSYQTSANIIRAAVYDANDIYYGSPAAKAIPGESVFLFATAADGFKPSQAVNDRGEKFAFSVYGEGIDTYAYYAQVSVPADATSMTVSAEAVAAYQVGGENIAIDGGHLFAAGETVSFAIAVPEGKKVESVSASDANGMAVAVTMDGVYGSFVMPAAAVTVAVSFKDVDPGENVSVKAIYDEDQYRVYSQTNPYYGAIDSNGVTVPSGTALYINVQDDYGEPFWVGIKIGDSVQYVQAEEDPESGEYTFGRSFSFTGDAVIKVGASQSAVAF